MAKKRTPIRQAEVVRRFAARLRELRHTRGMTQVDLARASHVSVAYISRLEGGGASPGLDLLDRLATALRASVTELVPIADPEDSETFLREQVRRQFEVLLQSADREMLLLLNPLVARLSGPGR